MITSSHDPLRSRPAGESCRQGEARTPGSTPRKGATRGHRATLALMALAATLLAGCNVGPRYTRPTYPTPPAFRGADEAAVASPVNTSLGDQQWAQVFREPELQSLIRTALTNNFDVRIAAQRILEQQAQVQITRAQQFPTLAVGGTGAGATLPPIGGTSFGSPLALGSFNLSAAWNPDFWGIYRKQT